MSVFSILFLLFGLINKINADLYGEQILNQEHGQLIEVTVNTSTMMVNILLSGDSKYWYGVGFNGTDMNNTYAIIVDGSDNKNNVYEYLLGSGTCSPGCDMLLESTLTINKNSNTDDIQLANITRNATINNSSYYSFPTKQGSINLIFAFGNDKNAVFTKSTAMAGHGERVIELLPM